MKRIISLLLVLALAAGLAACGGGTPAPSSTSAPGTAGQPTVAMGRWVEQEVLTMDGMAPVSYTHLVGRGRDGGLFADKRLSGPKPGRTAGKVRGRSGRPAG